MWKFSSPTSPKSLGVFSLSLDKERVRERSEGVTDLPLLPSAVAPSLTKEGGEGFTLIETILAMVVLAIGIFGTMHLFYQSAGRAFETDAYIQATSLARQKVEEIIFDKKMRGYAYVVGANYPSSETLAAPYDDYTRTLSMTEVNPSDLSSIQNNSGYKKVNVVVNWNGGSVTLETLVTLWGEL